jgi:hypothetical protein
MAVIASFRYSLCAAVIGIICALAVELAVAQIPQRLFVHDQTGAVIETLSSTLGGGFIRRGRNGRWLGRVTLVANGYHFLDRAGHTTAIARPEVQSSMNTTRQPLATIRDMQGRPMGTITAQ